jgi:hypothetical protein
MFHVEAERAPYAALVKLLTKEDVLLSELACRVLVRLLAARPDKDTAEPPRTDAAGASSSQPELALSSEVRPSFSRSPSPLYAVGLPVSLAWNPLSCLAQKHGIRRQTPSIAGSFAPPPPWCAQICAMSERQRRAYRRWRR